MVTSLHVAPIRQVYRRFLPNRACDKKHKLSHAKQIFHSESAGRACVGESLRRLNRLRKTSAGIYYPISARIVKGWRGDCGDFHRVPDSRFRADFQRSCSHSHWSG